MDRWYNRLTPEQAREYMAQPVDVHVHVSQWYNRPLYEYRGPSFRVLSAIASIARQASDDRA